MLRTALGPAIAHWLEDSSVIEVMLNPDGRIWIDRLADGLADTGEFLAPADGERILRLVAHHVGAEVHPGKTVGSTVRIAFCEQFGTAVAPKFRTAVCWSP